MEEVIVQDKEGTIDQSDFNMRLVVKPRQSPLPQSKSPGA